MAMQSRVGKIVLVSFILKGTVTLHALGLTALPAQLRSVAFILNIAYKSMKIL
jgi:hypothetical protein